MKSRKKRNIVIILLVIFVAVLLFGWVAVDYLVHRFYPLNYLDEIKDNSAKYSLESSQIAAIIYEESKFDPDVVSSRDAIGLMQVLPDTANLLAKDLGVSNLWRDDLFIPGINIRFGTYYYRQLLDKYEGNQDLALAAYNAGFGAVDKAEGNIDKLPKETQEFVKRTKKTERVYITLYPDQLQISSDELSKSRLNFFELATVVFKKIPTKNLH